MDDKSSGNNRVSVLGFNCSDSLVFWCQFKYCGASIPSLPEGPADLAANVRSSSQIDLSWTDNSEYEDGFVIERKTTAQFSEIARVEANVTSYSNLDLTEETDYAYRVSAFNISGYSEYTEEVSAKTESDGTTSSIVSKAESELILLNYPNPFHTITQIKFRIPKSGLVCLKVYDLSGRELDTLVNEKKQKGVYSTDFNGNVLPSGTYYCRLYFGDITVTKTLVLTK